MPALDRESVRRNIISILFYLPFWNGHLGYIDFGIHRASVQSMRGGLILKTTQMYARFQNGGGISLKAHMVFQYSASCYALPRFVHQLQSRSLVGAIIKSKSVVSRA